MSSALQAPVELDGLGTISEVLGLERTTASDLVQSGFLGEWFTVDGRLAAHAGIAQQLAQVPDFTVSEDTTPRALVVKVRPARQDDDDQDREYMGWHARLSPAQQADGVRGWWNVRDVDSWDGALLVATIAGFVVGVWRINGHETVTGTRHRFEVEPVSSDDEEAAFYLGHRMPPVRGGVTLRLGVE